MKIFTQIKVGYSSGIYGCSAEYFTAILFDGKKMRAVNHYGLYGSEDRVASAIKEAGYTEQHVQSPDYGKLKQRESMRFFMGEHEAIEYIKKEVK